MHEPVWIVSTAKRRREAVVGGVAAAWMTRAGSADFGDVRDLPGNTVRRIVDILVASAALVLAAPLVLVIAVLIKLDSPGPVLFRQVRLGRDGKRFEILKLRGMYADAEARFPELYRYSAEATGEADGYYFHSTSDPRVTRVGRFMRRWSVDELPNFWNVLRGDMTLVGPRPDIPELAHLYGESLDVLLSIKPGLTGAAKATGRDDLTYSETIAVELDYVRGHTLRTDASVLYRTAANVLRARHVR